MKRKPAPPRNRRRSDAFTSLKHEDAELRIYNNGILTIKGSIKNAAFALTKYVLDDKDSSIKIEYNNCIRINCKPGTPYTIDWLGQGVFIDDVLPEPKFWDEFKHEFERICKLKTFL